MSAIGGTVGNVRSYGDINELSDRNFCHLHPKYRYSDITKFIKLINRDIDHYMDAQDISQDQFYDLAGRVRVLGDFDGDNGDINHKVDFLRDRVTNNLEDINERCRKLNSLLDPYVNNQCNLIKKYIDTSEYYKIQGMCYSICRDRYSIIGTKEYSKISKNIDLLERRTNALAEIILLNSNTPQNHPTFVSGITDNEEAVKAFDEAIDAADDEAGEAIGGAIVNAVEDAIDEDDAICEAICKVAGEFFVGGGAIFLVQLILHGIGNIIDRNIYDRTY